MFRLVLCLLAASTSNFIIVQARVAVPDEKLSDISNNLIDEHVKANSAPVIHIDLPTASINDTTLNSSDKAEDHLANTTTTEISKICTTDKETIDNTIDSDNSTKVPCVPAKINNGTALILTPFIEENNIELGRNASRVDPIHFLGVESYSGFLTVDKKYDSNLFFWYFPIEGKPVKDSPWIIWLQGGPGASSMTGLFDEIGPLRFTPNGHLVRNPYTWLQNHSLVFIDNPVGTGYSYTMHEDGFVRDMDTYGSHLHSAVCQLVTLFPELRDAPLYVAGESYAGKYVPALAREIHRHKAQHRMNLKGLMIGNGYMDPKMMYNMVRPFYYFGTLGSKHIADLLPLITAFREDVDNNRSVQAKEKWMNLITLVLILTHQNHAYNFLRDDLPIGSYIHFLDRAEIKRSIHVGDIKFGMVNFTVNEKLYGDFLSNARPIYEELMEHYRVLVYCGQLDQMLPCVFSSELYHTWSWNGSQEFVNATRFPYIYRGRLAGYQKEGGGLTEVLIRGAGHMVPLDAPAAARYLVARWVRGLPLSPIFPLLKGSFVQEFVMNKTRLHTDNVMYL